jgi:hypothetical protein
VINIEGSISFFSFHCILHYEALYAKGLKIDCIMDTGVKIVNIIHASALNHFEFVGLLEETESEHN